MSVCGLAHLDSDSICALPVGHERDDDQHTDGVRIWRHHEEEVGRDNDDRPVYEVWDEAV